MKKIHIYRTASALAIVLAVWGFYETRRADEMKTALENNYNRAFHELVDCVDGIDVLLQKSMLVSSPAQMASLSGELFRQTSAAKACLGQLPVSEVHPENTEKFLSQVGDYTYYLSQNVINASEITETDYNNLNSLGKYAGILSEKLQNMQSDLYEGLISFGSVKNEETEQLGTVAMASGGILSNFEGVEKEFLEYPSLIYDGPFSEHIEKIQPVMTEDKEEISKEAALKKAKSFLGKKGENLSFDGESQNTALASYYFSCVSEESELSIAITKKGGYPVFFTENRAIGEESLDVSEARRIARDFLYSAGYTSLKDSYFEKNGGIATVNFAYEQGGVVCYSDLIKVKVALDNGEIIGTEMHGYLMNHKYRTLPAAVLSPDEAREKINSRLNVENTATALIPKDGQTEKLCYEFCGTHNDRNFIIYINAENGREEKILMLIESEDGILTI